MSTPRRAPRWVHHDEGRQPHSDRRGRPWRTGDVPPAHREHRRRSADVRGCSIVGFDEANVLPPPASGPLAAGASEEIDLEFLVPEAFAAGDHSVAVEVTTDAPGATPVIAGVTVTVGSIDDVALAVQPSTIRGRRRGRSASTSTTGRRTPSTSSWPGKVPTSRCACRPIVCGCAPATGCAPTAG